MCAAVASRIAGAQVGLDQYFDVVRADLLINIRGLLRIQIKDEGRVQVHHQPFAGRDTRRFLDFLGSNGHLVADLERIDQMNALSQRLAGDTAEQRQYADVAG